MPSSRISEVGVGKPESASDTDVADYRETGIVQRCKTEIDVRQVSDFKLLDSLARAFGGSQREGADEPGALNFQL